MEKRTLPLALIPFVLIACLIGSACNPSLGVIAVDTPTPQPTQTLTSSPYPTQTILPTSSPSPTPTLTATSTPEPTQTPQPSATTTPTVPPEPSPTETPSTGGFTVISISTKVKVGDYASARIQATPGITCALVYTTPSGTKSTAKGLGGKKAGADGVCAWRWRIGTSTRPGTGEIAITVEDQSETFPIEIIK